MKMYVNFLTLAYVKPNEKKNLSLLKINLFVEYMLKIQTWKMIFFFYYSENKQKICLYKCTPEFPLKYF